MTDAQKEHYEKLAKYYNSKTKTYGEVFGKDDILDEYRKTILEMEDKRLYKEMLEKEQIERAVIICNRENKFKLKGVCPNLCILGTDKCDDKVYMVTDRTIADNIREMLKWENKEWKKEQKKK